MALLLLPFLFGPQLEFLHSFDYVFHEAPQLLFVTLLHTYNIHTYKNVNVNIFELRCTVSRSVLTLVDLFEYLTVVLEAWFTLHRHFISSSKSKRILNLLIKIMGDQKELPQKFVRILK